MNYLKCLCVGAVILLLVGCSSESSNDEAMSIGSAPSFEAKQRQSSAYLAYTHQVTVELNKAAISSAYEKVINHCVDDAQYRCTVVHSGLNTGEYPSGSIQLRILPDGVDALIGVAASEGEVSNRSTDVEDLQEVIVNTDKRLEMLQQYQARLVALEKESTKDLDSLVKIAKELSQVQSDIEYATGESAKLLQRTQMDIVYINFQPRRYMSFWVPISESLNDFGENLSRGISQAITGLAFLLPWALFIGLLVFILRFFWRKGRARK